MIKKIVLAAVQQYGLALYYATDELRNDKDVVMTSIIENSLACRYSLLEGYQNFDEVVEKEGDEFLFSCWNNKDEDVRLQVANHPNFLPTLEQIEIGLKDEDGEVKEIYKLRRDEWLAKIEENKLRNSI